MRPENAPGGRFGIITAFEVVEHTNRQNALIEDMAGRLQADGVIMVSTVLQQPGFSANSVSRWSRSMPGCISPIAASRHSRRIS